ncbi:hypothetical protein GYMLUDRAFT_39788 [Collybiopsis luxurians FD-317 M1]|nr:hypothetical protein GYMLUDRAFT_39788 [Collybiopsis luxurians FD-317 M1]
MFRLDLLLVMMMPISFILAICRRPYRTPTQRTTAFSRRTHTLSRSPGTEGPTRSSIREQWQEISLIQCLEPPAVPPKCSLMRRRTVWRSAVPWQRNEGSCEVKASGRAPGSESESEETTKNILL